MGLEFIFALIILVVQIIIITSFLYERVTKISASPTMPWVFHRAVLMLKKHTDQKKEYSIAELGSGWGGPLVHLHNQYSQSSITGYELSPWPYLVSKLRSWPRRRMQVKYQNFFEEDLAVYNLIFCYLSNWHMAELKPKLAQLKPGSLIVSCSFPIPDWEPLEKELVQGPINIPIFLYRVDE